jgi:hypothetical protein
MTMIIYLEVINVLHRLGHGDHKIGLVEEYFKASHFIFINKEADFRIIEKTRKHIGSINLKTMDLIIMSSVIDLKPDYFYTYDQKLSSAYQKYIYEKNIKR